MLEYFFSFDLYSSEFLSSSMAVKLSEVILNELSAPTKSKLSKESDVGYSFQHSVLMDIISLLGKSIDHFA